MKPSEKKAEEDVFGRYSKYYDLLYRDKDYSAEATYIERTLRRAAPAARRLLEFGSGTGKHGRLLARAGFDVTGVERSAEMVAAAQKASPGDLPSAGSFRSLAGDVRTAHVDGAFDAVISLFHVVSYQTSNADLQATFRNAARHLRPGGTFFFDVWHGPAVLAQRPTVRIKRVQDSHTILRRIAEPEIDTNAGVVTVRYTMSAQSTNGDTIDTIEEEHRMRYLFPTEIELLAGETGFRLEATEEFGTGSAPSDATWGVAYLLRKHD